MLAAGPTPLALRRWALAGVITSALIILTGAAVRLSQSGLGCPDWPDCTANSLGAAGATGDSLIHRWIEFGNRLVTVAIFVVAVGVFIAAWRFRAAGGRAARDLLWLAAAQPGAIVLQAVLGGLVVHHEAEPGAGLRPLPVLGGADRGRPWRSTCAAQEGTAPARPLGAAAGSAVRGRGDRLRRTDDGGRDGGDRHRAAGRRRPVSPGTSCRSKA